MNLSATIGIVKNVVKQKGPEILVGIGLGGFIVTTITAVMETPKAIRMLNELDDQQLLMDDNIKLENFSVSAKDKFVVGIKAYWPAVILGGFSMACIISGHSIQYKRTAAATAAYILAQDSLKSFTEKTIEKIGERKTTEIKDEVAKQKMLRAPIKDTTIFETGNGNTLCFDAISGRYFNCSIEHIRKIENELNKRMMRENFISLNEFYMELDLPGIKFGDELGWDSGLEGAIDIEYSSQLNEYMQPCLVIDSDICPRWHVYA